MYLTRRIALILIGFLFSAVAAFAVPVVTMVPAVGPPTAKANVNGTGFAPSVLIEIYFDTTNLCLAVTNGSGAFTCKITVPKDAQPQQHWVTAVQRYTGAAAQKPFIVRTDMAQFHGRNAAHNGVNPFENTLNVSNVGDLDTLWSKPIGPGGTYGSAVVAAGRVYVGGLDGKLYAFDAVTGATIAGFPVNVVNPIVYSTPAVGGGRVFVGGNDSKLHAFNAATGAAVAGFPQTLPFQVQSSPSLALGNVYVGCNNGKLYAFNATTGVPVPGFPVNLAVGTINTSPTVIGGKVYLGSHSNNMYAFDALTGAAVGSFPILTGGPIYGSVAASGATGFFGSHDDNLRGFRLATGLPTPGFPVLTSGDILSSPAIAGGKVYVGSAGGVFSAYLIGEGFAAWNTTLNGIVTGSPMVANNVVYTSTLDRLYALSAASGAVLWSTDAIAGGLNSPVVANGILYYGSSDGNLYAFSVHGEPLSARRPGGALGIKPALSALKPDLSLKVQ